MGVRERVYGGHVWTVDREWNEQSDVQKRVHQREDLCIVYKTCQLSGMCISWRPALVLYVCHVCTHVLHSLSQCLAVRIWAEFPQMGLLTAA